MSNTKYPDDPVPLSVAARYLAVPTGWLREQIRGGHLPGLIADRAILVHLPTLAAQLAERAAKGEGVARG